LDAETPPILAIELLKSIDHGVEFRRSLRDAVYDRQVNRSRSS
jgi:hypothetical protein